MAKFLTTTGTSHKIENIIMHARKKLVLVSPYLQISKTFLERLSDAANNRVSIKIIYGKDELKPNQRNSLAKLGKVELYFFENLHAKCYFNESEMVITSMNMYEFSEKNNREMGIHITKLKDDQLFSDAVKETTSIFQASEKIPLSTTKRSFVNGQIKKKSTWTTKNSKKVLRGYCIRCEERIPLNGDKPYCRDCYTSWAQYENSEYKENVCHECGEFTETNMIKPRCYKCFKNSLSNVAAG